MKNLKSLIDDYCSVNTSRIIFDGFLNESDNISLTYQELFATIKEVREKKRTKIIKLINFFHHFFLS